MSVSNGTAMPAILRLGDCTPKRRPVEIERDGKTVVLQAYVYGPRCPTVVKCELAAAHDTWVESIDIDAEHPVEEWARRDRSKLSAEYQRYMRDCILALVPGVEWEEADALASDANDANSAGNQLLRYLEYFKPDVEPESAADKETGDTDENPPPNTAQLTMDLFSQTSLPATESGSKTGSPSRSA